ncbi:baculoviral IAP repeat-containing protein 2-like [Mytilus californianus]|uniref:baculoviral IAP repeat-containing protein 2-like n=1 Tax=Mytilus californianus TaxID=6549 RepID=UPI00224741AE|nr:baculoviral IAP repeat-containing protein 2-like [Mytilus californianus]
MFHYKMKENSFKNSDGDDTLGVCLKKPFNNGYTTVASRLRSFQCWSRPTPRPVDLSEAGFYYTGTEDVVQCFYCGLKLKSWDVFDDPWVEHARHGKNCPHVSNVKGKDFYTRLNEIENDGLNEKPKKSNLYTDDLLHTTAAQALVSMGYYKEQQIKDAIRTYVSNEDTLEFTAMDIAKILMNYKTG